VPPINRSIESSDSAVKVYVPVSLGLNVQLTKTAMYSPPVGGIEIPAFVTVVHTVKSRITDGTETPVEYLTELLYVESNHLSKSEALVGYAPYCEVEPLPAFTDQIS
jgi:hypothetical protein